MKIISKIAFMFCILLAIASARADVASPNKDDETLLLAYLRFALAQQVPMEADKLSKTAVKYDQEQAQAVVAKWSKQQISSVRASLNQAFGGNARSRFEKFVSSFTKAEQNKDAEYLSRLSASLGLQKFPPRDYAGLRKQMVELRLQGMVEDGSALLSKIQTWLQLKQEGKDVAGLEEWIKAPRSTSAGSVAARQPKGDIDALAMAEAPAGKVDTQVTAGKSPLDDFDQMQKDRRDRKLKEAQAGMAQVAAERKAAEEEYAAKKLAAAQADAVAIQLHADALTAVEQEALEQRQRSWGNRLKRILGTTISSVGGAVAGTVGARAGEEAADALFPPSE